MNIAICDDDYVIRDMVGNKCSNYFKEKNLSYSFLLFESGEELLQIEEEFDIIFLDIEMEGIAVAKLLKKRNPKVEIVFLTSNSEYMQQVFEVRAFRYKNISEVSKVLDQLIDDADEDKKVIIKSNGVSYIIKEKEIYFIKAFGDYSAVYLKDKYRLSNYTLKEWGQILSEKNFYQVHKSYIVAYDWIIDYSNKNITLDNEFKVPVSRRNLTKFNNAYKEFIHRAAR